MKSVLEKGQFILGPAVEAFEKDFAGYCECGHAIGVANGTDAILLGLKAVGIGPGDEVITAVNTFIATAEAIVHAGAKPVFVDMDPQSFTIDPAKVERAITPRTKAVIAVHLYGQPANLDPLLDLCRRRKILLIEDAAQAHGATYRGRRIGSFGSFACFSFYPAKNLGAYGDAGAVVTNDERIATTIRKLRDHGGLVKYQHDLVGFNSRLDGLQGAVLGVKLKHPDSWNRLRQKHAQLYGRLLGGIPSLTLPAVSPHVSHVYHLYVIQLEQGDRKMLQEHLRLQGIASGIHYPYPLHLLQAFAYLNYHQGDFPMAEYSGARILSLPMHPWLTPKEIRHVAEEVKKFIREVK